MANAKKQKRLDDMFFWQIRLLRPGLQRKLILIRAIRQKLKNTYKCKLDKKTSMARYIRTMNFA